MAVKKLPSGKWQAQVFPEGRDGRRIRRLFTTKGEAMAFERHLLSADKPWQNQAEEQEERRLSDLVDRWYGLHGQSLTDGTSRLSKLNHLVNALGDPVATEFTAKDFASYRERRLAGDETTRPVTPTTVNREHACLRAVFNELKRLGEWDGANPLDGIRTYKVSESELAFLYQEEIVRLLDACKESQNPDLYHVVRICLATGARWSEAETLTQSQLSPYRVSFIKTKGKRNRTIPISPELFASLPRRRGRLFKDCYEAFRDAVARAKLELPEGQCSHVLRHTFASHFMMNGGNILVLQRILGHSTITMTMRYAHFAPNHLEDAVKLNPLTLHQL
jgi:integrase